MNARGRTHLLPLIVAAVAAPTFAQSDSAQAANPAAPIPKTDVPGLAAALYDPNARPDQREQTAQRLLSRPGTDARDVLRKALANYGQPAVQLAAARALANRPTADDSLKKPLFDLLDYYNGDALIDAAGRALTAYKSDPDALTHLIALGNTGDERVRAAAIRATGTFVDKRAAAALVPLTDITSQPYRVANAAQNALAYLAGQSPTIDWPQWWQTNQAKPDAQFLADLARDRAARYDLARTRVTELEDEFARTLADLYQKTPRDGRSDLLLRYMRSTESSVRTAATAIARKAAENDLTPPPVKEQLRTLVGDSSPDVRRGAASALALINDSDAVVPLLTQLSQETDSGVKAAIAEALRPTRDDRATGALMALLDDPSNEAAQAAAEALGEVGQRLRQTDPAAADQVADRLLKVLQTRTTAQNNLDLRNSLVQALGSLQSPPAGRVLQALLESPAEDRRVRRSLLTALGNYHQSGFTGTIARWLADKNDAGTRLAAVRALGESVESFGDYERQLADRLAPTEEREIRDATWRVLTKLFPKASGPQLGTWENRLRDDPAKLLVVLREQRDRALRNGDADLAAGKNQQIGDACSRTSPPQFNEAIAAYQSALDYATQNNKPNRVETISNSLTQAYLNSRQFDKAIDFTQAKIKENPKFQEILGPNIPQAADRLVRDQKDFDAANRLMDMALKMNPALAPRYAGALKELQAQVRSRYNQQNQVPMSPDEAVQTAMATPGR